MPLRCACRDDDHLTDTTTVTTFWPRQAPPGVTWTGCLRAAFGPREAAFIEAYRRSDGALSYTEQRTAPGPLLDAFAIIDRVRAWKAEEERENAKREREAKQRR